MNIEILSLQEILPSFHDCYIASYEVDCEARVITLRIRLEDKTISIVKFLGVEGYRFENDAFGNIILDLEQVTVHQLLVEFGAQITESYRMSGAPGPWASDITSAGDILTSKGVQGYILSSSYGMSGWILARETAVFY